ncbi:hypothetical protein FLK61_30465 [Paenalkalicoccus suaedae]|uniref:Uncharacterized protein n=1 Tax=Paenalkalicoccus suaedae TaxID=2592382 RepID=A0A859FEA9_9BACI|nr:hypothetical protein [Paenalkalicoccus suaedae]QKS71042.1 hypothetical protein FLK61_30465 [Paenalkalicoccus suaedae]
MMIIILLSLIGSIVITLQIITIKIISKVNQLPSDLSVDSEDKQSNLQADLQEEMHQAITYECLTMYNAVSKQIDSLHANEIRYVIKQPSWNNSALLEHLSADEKELYLFFKTMFDTYVETYWLNSKGTVRTVFTQTDTPTSFSEKTISQASLELQSKMRQWFDNWS